MKFDGVEVRTKEKCEVEVKGRKGGFCIFFTLSDSFEFFRRRVH